MQVDSVVVVYNSHSGSFRQRVVDEIEWSLQQRGKKVVCLQTMVEPGVTALLVKKAIADGAQLVVVCGGDGTIDSVLEGREIPEVPIIAFPGGTGNVWARSHYSDPSPAEFVEMILNGIPQTVDVITAEYVDLKGNHHRRRLLVGYGAGPLADAISTAKGKLKRIFGQLFYAFKVVVACLRPSSRRFRLKTVAGDKSMAAAAVLAMNITPPFMSSLSLGCNAHDGLMDLVVFEAGNFWQLLKMAFWIAIRRPQKSRHYKRMRVKEVVITSEQPMLPNLDGDAGELCHEVKLTLEPGAVKMILC